MKDRTFEQIYKFSQPLNVLFKYLNKNISNIDSCLYEIWEKYPYPGQVSKLQEAALTDKIKYEINDAKENIGIIINRLNDGECNEEQIEESNKNIVNMYGHIDNMEKAYRDFKNKNDTLSINLYEELNNSLKEMWSKILEYNKKYENKLLSGKEAHNQWIEKNQKSKNSLIKTWSEG